MIKNEKYFSKVELSVTNHFFAKNFNKNFCDKNRFVTKISTYEKYFHFDQNFDFRPKFRFSTHISIFDPNSKLSRFLLWQIFDFQEVSKF